jgi:putative SOS response-associated peptidase YedK
MRTFAIITPNELCAQLHNRMPVVLKPDACWFSSARRRRIHPSSRLAGPFPADEMTCWPVSARVGNVENNDASLIELSKAALH